MAALIPLSRHGFWELLVGTVVLGAATAGAIWWWWPLAIPPVLVWLWLVAFFRDPERPVPLDASHMVSPADGTVSDITEVSADSPVDEPALRVGIFLNVFNVHVNRSPCDGRVARVIYKKGKFLNAMNHAGASSDNESNTVVLVDPASRAGDPIDGRPIAAVRQIVGLIARRIVCDLRPGESTGQGERFGLIKFGSRTELYVPMRLTPTATVKVGQKVRGGADVIMRLGVPSTAPGVTGGPSGTLAAKAEPPADH